MGKKPCQLDIREEGVFLTVADGAGSAVTDILEYLRSREIADFNKDAVAEAIKTPGIAVKVAGRNPSLDRDAEVLVRVSEDALSVSVRLLPPLGRPWPVEETIRGELSKVGVVFGIDEETLKEIVDKRRIKEWIPIAKGVAPENGKNAEFIYHVDLHKAKPKQVGDSKVDMKDLGVVINVNTDQELVEKIPPKISTDGTSVYGKTISAIPAKDKPMPSGKNTHISEDGLHLFASIDGCVLVQDSKIHVQPIFTVEGDVDYGTGNIDFIGDVHVKGTLREGFEIKAGGNVFVGGVMEGAELTAGGSVEIHDGIRGIGKARVFAKGDVVSGYLDQCTVTAEGGVNVTNSVMHSTIRAKREFIASGKKGLVVGGSIQAGTQIRCETLGNEMGTKTDLHVGVNPLALQDKNEAEKNLKERKKQYEEVTKNIDFLKKVEALGKLDNEKRQILLKLTQAKFQIQANMEETEKKLKEMTEDSEKAAKEGRVSVRGSVYPGVSIHIRGLTYLVRDSLKHVTFMYEDGEIRAQPYIQ